MTSEVLSPGEFSAAVSAITNAFGDPTRRAIYLFAHEHPHGVTAAQVAVHHPQSFLTLEKPKCSSCSSSASRKRT